MKLQFKVWVLGCAALFVAAVAVQAEEPKKDKPAAPAQGQPGGEGQPQMTPEQMAEMQAMMEAGTPGPEHDRFKQVEGLWKTENKFWHEPGAEPEVSQGQATYKVIMGGRYCEEVFKSDWNGMPFEGRGLCGYDNVLKKYVGVWYDNMSTGIMTMQGTYDPATKTMTTAGEYACPIAKGMKKMRIVEKEVSETKRVAEFYMDDKQGKEFKSMEITYTR